jgi:hypothetical protein
VLSAFFSLLAPRVRALRPHALAARGVRRGVRRGVTQQADGHDPAGGVTLPTSGRPPPLVDHRRGRRRSSRSRW